MEPTSLLVIGGCRSGKSRHALDLVNTSGYPRKVFIATCQPLDAEMKDRVLRHQQERGPEWETVETPLHLPEAVFRQGGPESVLLIDCLTLWISNLVLRDSGEEHVLNRIKELAQAVKESESLVVMVTNEVGAGIVPENALARRYRDQVGFANQLLAGACDRVDWCVAGIPMTIKPSLQRACSIGPEKDAK